MAVPGQALRVHGVHSGLRAEIELEAREWDVAPAVARVLFAVPLLGVAAVLAVRPDRDLFDFLTREDSVFEWTQFAGYSLAVLIGIAAARRFASLGAPWLARAFVVFAAANTFIAGEEISWGQRIFGWGTPAALDNKQHETTVHNVKHVLSFFNAAMLLIGLVGFALPWLLRRSSPRAAPAWLRVLAPPLFLTSAFFVLFGYKLARFVAFRQPTFTAERFGEWAEVCLALSLFGYAFLVWRTAPSRLEAAAAAATGGAGLRIPSRRVLVAVGLVVVAAVAAAGVHEVGKRRHRHAGSLTRAALAGVRTGMSQTEVRALIGRPGTKCWYYADARLCFDRAGALESSSSSAGRYARLRPGASEETVRTLVGEPPRKCWFYRPREAREQLCFADGRLASKPPG